MKVCTQHILVFWLYTAKANAPMVVFSPKIRDIKCGNIRWTYPVCFQSPCGTFDEESMRTISFSLFTRIQWNNCDHGTQNIAIRFVNSTHNSHKCTHSSYFYNILHWSFLFGLLALKIHFIFIFVDFYSLDDTLIVQNDAVPMCRTFTLKIFLLLLVLLLLVAFINILSCLSCL